MGIVKTVLDLRVRQGAGLNQLLQSIPDVSTKQEISLATYDGSGETIHPSIVSFDSEWNGFKYWMANTPLPGGQATPSDFENPSIWASNDGVTWVVPSGLTNPIVAKPIGGFNSDTDIIYENGKLYVIWKETTGSSKTKIISSADGITWGDIKTILTPASDETENISPSIIKIGSIFYIYYSYYKTSASDLANSGLRRVSCETIDGTYANRQQVVAPTTQRMKWWHLDVAYINGSYMLASNESPGGSVGDIFTLSSKDGINFLLDSAPTITATATHDINGCYRPSFVKINSDWWIYYSCKAATPTKSSIGRIKITLQKSDYVFGVDYILSDKRRVNTYYLPKLEANVIHASGAISQITDLSTNGYHLSTTTTNRKPTFSDGAIFNGSSNSLSVPFSDKIRCMIMVVKQNSWTANNVLFDGYTINTALIRQRTASPGIAVYKGGQYSNVSNDLPINQFGILRLFFDSGYSKFIVNNNSAIDLTSSGSFTPGGITIGSNGDRSYFGNLTLLALATFKYMPTQSEEIAIYNKMATDCGLPTI